MGGRAWRASLGALLALCVTFGVASQVVAQARHEPPPEALEYFRSGREHYQHGRYREAATDLERALALDPASPTLLYNIARVHELLGEAEEAAGYYRSYLRVLPEGSEDERAEVQATITRLEGAAAHGEISRPPPDDGTREDLRPAYVQVRGVVDLPFWITLGSGGGLLLGGVALGIAALGSHSDATSLVLRTPEDANRRQSLLDTSRRRALASDLLMGIGLGALIASGLLYLLRQRTLEVLPGTQVLPGTTADGRGASLTLRLTL